MGSTSLLPEVHAGLRQGLLDTLNGIVDPCSAATSLPAGLVDMGLIRSLVLKESADHGVHCSVSLCVTHAFCMMTGVFVHEIEKRLGAHPGVQEVEVLLDYRTIWTEDMMAESYRARLEEHRRSNEKLTVRG
jgi:metal-sulfur cluster biosynthetic enzyme